MNTFDAFNIFYREDVISDFLVNCFKDSKEFLNRFLINAGIHINSNLEYQIDTRVGLGKSIGTPDIVIRANTGDKMNLIIIENKMGAAEGHEQTHRYESQEARTRIAKKYNKSVEDIDFHFIFLALDTTTKPKSSRFTFLNYQIFLSGNWQLMDKNLRILLKDFQEKLELFYRPILNPYKSLEHDLQMDGMQRKICWQTILFESFQAENDLILDWGEVGGSGRNNFLFLITKRNWTSAESFREVGLSKTFNIHIDTYINLLDSSDNTVNEIGIRFETFPYVPHKKSNVLPGYESFMENKNRFGEMLYNLAKTKGITAKKRNSKLLVMTIPIQGETIQNTVQSIKEQVMSIESCIDEIVREMIEEGLIA